MTALMEKVRQAPDGPGCYLFRDAAGNVVYVGKSKRLAQRVRHYFQASARVDDRVGMLVRVIADVAYVTTATELDALVEEYRLIKYYRPWFNAQHKRDAVRYALRIDRGARYPAICAVPVGGKLPKGEEGTEEEPGALAGVPEDGAEYFGIFRDVFAAREAMELLGDVLGTPRCGKRSFGDGQARSGRARPCLHYAAKRCMAPCGGVVAQEAYGAAVADAIRVLSGEGEEIVARLEAQMRTQAAACAYERAAWLKERAQRLEALRLHSRRRLRIVPGTDALVMLRAQGERVGSAFVVRGGRVLDQATFARESTRAEVTRFVRQAAMGPLQGRDWGAPAGWITGCLMEVLAVKDWVAIGGPEDAGQMEACADALWAFLQRTWMPDGVDAADVADIPDGPLVPAIPPIPNPPPPDALHPPPPPDGDE